MENTNYNQTRRRSFFNAYFVQTLLKQYAKFSGVQSRKSYWLTILAYFIISIGVAGLLFITSVVYSSPADMPLVSAIGSLFGLIFLIPCIAIAVRRLRDAGQNPWLFLSLYALPPCRHGHRPEWSQGWHAQAIGRSVSGPSRAGTGAWHGYAAKDGGILFLAHPRISPCRIRIFLDADPHRVIAYGL